MNLGDARLKSVNTSRPQLLHTDSKRSITATDDYYSLSDHASEVSSGNEQPTIIRYQTHPSQIHSPHTSQDLLRGQTIPEHVEAPNRVIVANKSIRFIEQATNTRQPLVEDSMTTWKSSRTEVSPPTPGVDDTPYIQFAIDQLTRDEELTGRRRIGNPDGDVSPIEPDLESIIQHRDYIEPVEPVSPQEQDVPLAAPRFPIYMPMSTENILVPADPPVDRYRFPALDFIPASIRLIPLIVLIVCCLFMMTGLIVSSVWSSKHNGLIPYDGLGTRLYFVFEFLPQILGAIIVLWVIHIQAVVQRILPFTLLALERRRQHAGTLYDTPLFLTNFLIPNLSSFRQGEPVLGLCFVIFWLIPFTVPLLSSVYQTRLYMTSTAGTWTWTLVQPIGWTLIGLYFLLTLALLLLFFRLRGQPTGLKWDPVSLADIFVLLRRSNVTTNFEGSEVRAISTPSRPASLGYWQASNRPGEIFYGIGEDDASPRGSSPGRGKRKLHEKPATDLESQTPAKSATRDSLHTDVHASHVRYRWTPWFLRDTWWIFWLVLAFVLTIAFLVVSFVHQAVASGFLPLLPAPTTTLGFSPANFLYSFLPSLLGMILFLVWQPVDMYYRAMEPFARLARPQGATAEQSLLLNYTACLPVEVSIRAALAGHYRVAWISFVGLLSVTLPILGGGLFTAEFNVPAQEVREVATMPAYYALVVFVITYAFSVVALWPESKRYLPHDIRTVGDVVSFVYQSPMTRDHPFEEPRTKIDLVTRLVSVPAGEREIPTYAFGVYRGRDGREHLGIDRCQRPEIGGRRTEPTGRL